MVTRTRHFSKYFCFFFLFHSHFWAGKSFSRFWRDTWYAFYCKMICYWEVITHRLDSDTILRLKLFSNRSFEIWIRFFTTIWNRKSLVLNVRFSFIFICMVFFSIFERDFLVRIYHIVYIVYFLLLWVSIGLAVFVNFERYDAIEDIILLCSLFRKKKN